MSDGVVLIARAQLRAECRDEAISWLERIQSGSRSEPDCLTYNVHIGADDPEMLIFYEAWKDQDAFQSHLDSPAFAEFMQGKERYIDGEVKIINLTCVNRMNMERSGR